MMRNILVVVSLSLAASAVGEPPRNMLGLPLLFSDDFATGQAERWQPGDPNAWRIAKQGENHVLSQFQQSKIQTPVRSPFNRSLIKELVVMGASMRPVADGTPMAESVTHQPRREFNHWWDPEAARIALRAPWPKVTVTTVDISVKTRLSKALIDEIGRAQTPAAPVGSALLCQKSARSPFRTSSRRRFRAW